MMDLAHIRQVAGSIGVLVRCDIFGGEALNTVAGFGAAVDKEQHITITSALPSPNGLI